MAPCCTCNGKNAVCKRCVCARSGRPCVSCLPLRNGNCTNNGITSRVICTGKEKGVDKVEEVGTNSSPSSENVSDASVTWHVVCSDVPPRENVSGTSIVCSDGLPTSNIHTYFNSLMLKAYGSTLVNSEGEIPSSPWYSR